MENLQNLLELNFRYVFISVCIILVGLKYLINLFEWFIKKFGLETKTMRKKREEHDLILKTAQGLQDLKELHQKDINDYLDKRKNDRSQSFEIQQQLTNAITNVNLKLDEMKKDMVEKDISDMRWNIINTANKISEGKTVSREGLKFALKTYDKYEKTIEANNMTNSEVDVSIKIIKNAYLENGD